MRLIDADRLKQNWLFRGRDGKPYRDTIDAQPTIEPERPNNTGYRWELLSGGDINSRGLCEADVIYCPECHYTTNPQIVKWEYNGNTYGKATVPRICPKCHALMEAEHE